MLSYYPLYDLGSDNMKGFLLELKNGIDMDTAKSELENLLGQGRVEFKNGVSGILATDIMVKEGSMDKVNIYQVNIHFPKTGTVAVVGKPAYDKLLNAYSKKPMVPRSLDSYFAGLTECKIDENLYGAQG